VFYVLRSQPELVLALEVASAIQVQCKNEHDMRKIEVNGDSARFKMAPAIFDPWESLAADAGI